MANIVEQINDAIETRIASVISSETLLEYKLDIEKNSWRNQDKRYGCIPLSANTSTPTGINKHYTLDHEFQVILTKGYVNRHDDIPQREAMFTLYSDMDEIAQDLFLSKAGLPSIVMIIQEFSILEPEYLSENNVAVLRANFVVKYRQEVA